MLQPSAQREGVKLRTSPAARSTAAAGWEGALEIATGANPELIEIMQNPIPVSPAVHKTNYSSGSLSRTASGGAHLTPGSYRPSGPTTNTSSILSHDREVDEHQQQQQHSAEAAAPAACDTSASGSRSGDSITAVPQPFKREFLSEDERSRILRDLLIQEPHLAYPHVVVPESQLNHGETEELRRRLEQRRKQIQYGKGTSGYSNYCKAVPHVSMRELYNPMHPITPRPEYNSSKRSFDKVLNAWRRQLHLWDSCAEDDSNNNSGREGTAVAASTDPHHHHHLSSSGSQLIHQAGTVTLGSLSPPSSRLLPSTAGQETAVLGGRSILDDEEEGDDEAVVRRSGAAEGRGWGAWGSSGQKAGGATLISIAREVEGHPPSSTNRDGHPQGGGDGGEGGWAVGSSSTSQTPMHTPLHMLTSGRRGSSVVSPNHLRSHHPNPHHPSLPTSSLNQSRRLLSPQMVTQRSGRRSRSCPSPFFSARVRSAGSLFFRYSSSDPFLDSGRPSSSHGSHMVVDDLFLQGWAELDAKSDCRRVSPLPAPAASTSPTSPPLCVVAAPSTSVRSPAGRPPVSSRPSPLQASSSTPFKIQLGEQQPRQHGTSLPSSSDDAINTYHSHNSPLCLDGRQPPLYVSMYKSSSNSGTLAGPGSYSSSPRHAKKR